MRVPTVKIVTENGPIVINESDYQPDLHEIYEVETHNPGTADWYRDELTAIGVDFDVNMNKPELKALYEALPTR